MGAVEMLLKVARNEIGYMEKRSNADLDDKTANAGNANFTKYARDLQKVTGFYNGGKQGIAWCDIFVDWCFVQAFGAEIGRKLLCQPKKSAGAGCNSSMTYYKNKNQFYEYPEIGDQIFFWSSTEQNKAGHTGIVVNVTNDRVYTIEGNTYTGKEINADGGAVCEKNYIKTNVRIAGYGRPDWSIINNGDDESMEVNYQATVTAPKGKTVNLRSKPSSSSNVLKLINIGDKVMVVEHTDESGIWAKINVNGLTGYMMREYLKSNCQDNDEEVIITLSKPIAQTLYEILNEALKK